MRIRDFIELLQGYDPLDEIVFEIDTVHYHYYKDDGQELSEEDEPDVETNLINYFTIKRDYHSGQMVIYPHNHNALSTTNDF